MNEEYAIIAELPLGVYRGRQADGTIDPVPAPARLHGALLNAAAAGPRAQLVNGELTPCAEDKAALNWLEHNPPTGVRIPRTLRTSSPLTVYRLEGTIKKEGGNPRPSPKRTGKDFAGVIAVKGPFAWTWKEAPPPEVVDSFAALVGDVPHLGTSESPARVSVGTASPTHRLDPRASIFEGSGEDLDVATPGRTDALLDAYRQENLVPTVARDRYTTSEEPLSRPGWNTARASARYVPVHDEPLVSTSPWDVVLLRPLEGADVAADERVAFAVAVHRALVRTIGFGAPAIVTGAATPGVRQPANRLALHVLDADAAELAGLEHRQHLALLLPRGAHPVEVSLVTSATSSLRRIRGRTLGPVATRPGSTFWPAVVGGTRRRWITDPVAVPETRAPRTRSWDLADVVRLSLAMVHRDAMPDVPGRGEQRYGALSDHVASLGVEVPEAGFVPTSDVSRYVHKAPERGVVRPYRAVVTLGDLASDRALLAVGQTRHLGGGLLIPADEVDG